MMNRVTTNGDTDVVLFYELLYAGEFITKLAAAALVAALEDEREKHRYRFMHTLVRADGIGDWVTAIEELCTGPASEHICSDFGDIHRQLTQRATMDCWQYKSVIHINEVLSGIHSESQTSLRRIYLRLWFGKFAELRNKTRGHGSPTPATCARLVPKLQDSIRLIVENSSIFQQPWAYLHRNLSGRYNVVGLGGNMDAFNKLKTAVAIHQPNYPDGVYLWAGRPRIVDLLHSDLNLDDFFVPNGAFNGKTYELHSPITDDRRREDADRFLSTPTGKPESETEGKNVLDVYGNVFSNLPTSPTYYVRRPQIEAEIRDRLLDDRHPIITLVGRGGIGKTSLALTILHELTEQGPYDVIVWFSARDIDLTSTGPKVVRPRTLTVKDIGEVYCELISIIDVDVSKERACKEVIETHMRNSPLGSTLFVFDNFETVRYPSDLYSWIDPNVSIY